MNSNHLIFNCDCNIVTSDFSWKPNFRINLISLEDDEREIENKKIKIFGCIVNLDDCKPETIKHIISNSIKLVNLLQNASFESNNELLSRGGLKINWLFLRREIARIFILIKHLVNDKKYNYSKKTKFMFLTELKHFLLFIGRISSLPESVFYELSNVTNSSAASNNLFHLYLDIWWNAYQVFSTVSNQFSDELFLIKDKFFSGEIKHQIVNLILADLISVAFSKFNNEDLVTNFNHLSPFPCDCVKLLYILIQQSLLVDLSSCLHPFWIIVNKSLDSIKDLKKNLGPDSIRNFQWLTPSLNTPKDFELGSIWLISNLTQIFNYDTDYKKIQIDLNQNEMKISNYVYILKLVQDIVKDENSDFKQTRFLNMMKLSYKFFQVWEPNIDLVLPFLDFFMKKLNQSFLQNDVQSLQIIPKSGFLWSQKIKNKIENSSTIDYEENLASLFYNLLYDFILKIFDNKCSNMNNQFQKLKGRFYSKLQPKKIEELKEIGIYNLLNLYLTIVYAAKKYWLDLVDKFSQIIKYVKSRNLFHNKMTILLKAVFCFEYLIEDNEDTSKLTEIGVGLFNLVCDNVSHWSPDNLQQSIVHNSCMNFISVYCEELITCLNNSKNVPISFSTLISPKFGPLVQKLSEREILNIINFIGQLFSIIKKKLDDRNYDQDFLTLSKIYTCSIDIFTNLLKTQFQSKNGCQDLPKIIFDCSYLAVLISSNDSEFNHYLTNFAFNKLSNIVYAGDFIINLLNCEITGQKIIDFDSVYLENQILELWSKYSISVLHPNAQFDKLTSSCVKICKYFHPSETGINSILNTFLNLNTFFNELLGTTKAKFANDVNKSLCEMISLGKNYLKDDTYSEEMLFQLYKIFSHLIENCSEIIYLPGNTNSVLPQILESFYNPIYLKSLSSAKQQLTTNCVKKNLPKILKGLEKFNEKKDPYIERKLRQIMTFYIPLFLSKSYKHPLIIALKTKDGINENLLNIILNYLNDFFFNKTTTNPAQSIQIIQFISEMHNSVYENKDLRKKIFNLYPLFLNKLMISEELIKRRIKELLINIINDYKNMTSLEQFTNTLVHFYEQFVTDNKTQVAKVIKVLELTLPINPEVKEKVISMMLRLIHDLEDSKSGSDDQLRKSFQQFVNNMTKI